MERFVKHFHNGYDTPPIEEQINKYAVKRNLTIITITPLYQNGMYVLFEKKGGVDNDNK